MGLMDWVQAKMGKAAGCQGPVGVAPPWMNLECAPAKSVSSRIMVWCGGAALAVALLLPIGAVGSGPSAERRYALGVGDEVRVKVYEWRSAVNNVHEWTALNGEYQVGPDGTIALPLVGEVPVEGLTTEAAAAAISDRLQRKIGLANLPDAAVQIVKFRPFFIVGSVSKPGEYAYRPDLTVLQAVSMAGGFYRGEDSGSRDLERGSTSAMGEWRLLRLQRNRLLARAARLQAELDGKSSIPVPPELRQTATEAEMAELMKEEEAIAKARSDAFQAKIDGMLAVRDLLNKEVVSLTAKTANAEEEIKMVRGEAQNIAGLLKNGLVTSPRDFALRQNSVQLQGKRLDVDTALLETRQKIGRLDQQMTDLRNDHRKELLKEWQQNGSALAELTEKLKTQRQVVDDLDGAKTRMGMVEQTDARQPRFSIIARVGQQTSEAPATEMSIVKPGDTIRVIQSKDPAAEIAARQQPRSAPADSSVANSARADNRRD